MFLNSCFLIIDQQMSGFGQHQSEKFSKNEQGDV